MVVEYRAPVSAASVSPSEFGTCHGACGHSTCSGNGACGLIVTRRRAIERDARSEGGKSMTWLEAVGYVASVLVLSTFYMKTMVPLRCCAIASNIAFIAYGFFGEIYPVLILHLVLLPLTSSGCTSSAS